MEIGTDEMNPAANEQSYGCDINSATPLCSNGECSACTVDDDCEGIPGAGDFCDQGTGKCGVCQLGGDRARPAQGCNEVVPICVNMSGRNTCMECGDSTHCNDRPCVRGRCQVCNPETHEGCRNDMPMCVFDSINGRGFTCVNCREGQRESDTACRIRDCFDSGLEIDDCNTTAQCRAGACQACSQEGGFCADGRLCAEGECRPCNEDRDCLYRGELNLGFICEEGRCATKVMCRSREAGCLADELYSGFDCVRGECGLCQVGTPCSDGTVCASDPVARLPACQPCNNRVPCPDGFECNVERGTCFGESPDDQRPQ